MLCAKKCGVTRWSARRAPLQLATIGALRRHHRVCWAQVERSNNLLGDAARWAVPHAQCKILPAAVGTGASIRDPARAPWRRKAAVVISSPQRHGGGRSRTAMCIKDHSRVQLAFCTLLAGSAAGQKHKPDGGGDENARLEKWERFLDE